MAYNFTYNGYDRFNKTKMQCVLNLLYARDKDDVKAAKDAAQHLLNYYKDPYNKGSKNFEELLEYLIKDENKEASDNLKFYKETCPLHSLFEFMKDASAAGCYLSEYFRENQPLIDMEQFSACVVNGLKKGNNWDTADVAKINELLSKEKERAGIPSAPTDEFTK